MSDVNVNLELGVLSFLVPLLVLSDTCVLASPTTYLTNNLVDCCWQLLGLQHALNCWRSFYYALGRTTPTRASNSTPLLH